VLVELLWTIRFCALFFGRGVARPTVNRQRR
jgi:hypothetical protein